MAEKALVLIGVKDTLAALKKFDEDAVKGFNKVISAELRQARDQARNKVDKIGSSQSDTPMRGWRKVEPKNLSTAPPNHVLSNVIINSYWVRGKLLVCKLGKSFAQLSPRGLY